MTRIQTWLSGLLALQLLVAVALFWYQGQPQQQNRQQALLSFQPEQLQQVIVSDADHSVTLSKSGQEWLIPELQQLPADTGKLDELLRKLQSLQTGWPVATTSESHERFEVAEDKFQRRLQLYEGDTLAGEIFIGTSPGFRHSHVRRAGDDAVYNAKLNSFDWPINKEDWLNKTLLAISDINRIRGSDYDLQKKADGWHFVKSEKQADDAKITNPSLDQEKAKQLVTALTSLRVQSLATNPPAAEGKSVSVEVSSPQGTWNYRFIQVENNYYVSRNDRNLMFNLSRFDYERIANIESAQLVLTTTEPTEGSPKISAASANGRNVATGKNETKVAE